MPFGQHKHFTMPETTPIKIALDWTPNTLHTGLYVALAKDFFSRRDLSVQLLPPDASYSQTPAKLLENGKVDFAICPSESCIAYHHSGKMQLQAVYAILQRDASAIVSTEIAGIGQLGEGKVYGSYNARYEDHIVRSMVSHDGGNGDGMKIQSSEGKLDLFAALKKGDVDATWIFMPWEGVEAELEGVKLHAFKTEDYGVPYGYSPVIAQNAASERLSPEVLKDFVAAVREGYEYALQHVSESVEILSAHCQPPRSKEFLERSQNSINAFYGGEGKLGSMKSAKWKTWVEWLKSQGLLDKIIEPDELFCNVLD